MKTNNKHKKHHRVPLSIIVAFFVSILSSSSIIANELYTASRYIDVSHNDVKNNKWLSPIVIQNNNNELLLTTTQGKVYRTTGGKVELSPIVDFSNNFSDIDIVNFSAITLHPNFHRVDEKGEGKLYTAHIELYNPTSKKARLQDGHRGQKFSHDTVVMEWELSNIPSKNVEIVNKREIIRVGTNSISKFTHLSFNTFLKPWNDDFGLLHIALTEDTELINIPLYSGVILRINPQQFGLRNYTIPHNNPFSKSSHIKDEIIIVGAQDIQKLIWSKHSKDSLVLSHTYNNKPMISAVPNGTNFMIAQKVNPIIELTSDLTELSSDYYRGRDFIELWNKVVFLDQIEGKWQLSASQVLNSKNSSNPNLTKLSIDLSSFPKNNDLNVFVPKEDLLLIWDDTNKVIYKIITNPDNSNKSVAMLETGEDNSSNSNSFTYFIVLLLLSLISLFFLKSKYQELFSKNKTLLRSNFAKIGVDEKSHKLFLFKRHETEIDTIIQVPEIYSSEVFLNHHSINIVNPDFSCNQTLENEMRMQFAKEHRDKMIDDKVRKINLKVTTAKGEEFLICVYLREGNQRLTKEKYHIVIDQLIDWQWYLSSQICSDKTPKRTPKKVIKPQPATPKAMPAANKTHQHIKKPLEKNIKNNVKITSSEVDTKLVDALNKLVSLKEQGYLTEKEFLIAKQNLLENLTNNL